MRKFFGIMLVFLFSVVPVFADITVDGLGETSVTPDTAILNLTVYTSDTSAKGATGENATQTKKVLSTLQSEYKISEGDISTSGYHVYPQYDKTQAQQIVGYHAQNSITVKTRDIEKASKILGALSSDTIRINGVYFVASDELRKSVMDKLRTAAMQDAKNRASTLAKAADLKLSSVKSIVESTSHSHIQSGAAMSLMERADRTGSVPLSAGKATIQLRVNVVFVTQ